MRTYATLVLTLLLAALLSLPAAAQDATPEPQPVQQTTPEVQPPAVQPPSVTATAQLSLDGTVTVDNVTSPTPGWIAIHADANGQPGVTVGIAPVQAGVNQSVRIAIDTLGATTQVYAVLHVDDGQIGVYEYGMVPGADAWVLVDNQIVMSAFSLTAIRAFDQAVTDGTVVIASVITSQNGWLVIHADNNGQPGPVLGQWLVPAGTTPAVTVPLAQEGRTPVLWPMIHVDDGQQGVYEFDGASGLDAPVSVNGTVATTSFNVTSEQTVMTAAGAPIETPDGAQPFISAFSQFGMGDGTTGTLTVTSVFLPVPGWVDVHADVGGHPGKSLGHAPVPANDSVGLLVALNAMGDPLSPPTTLPSLVWPMLHVDDGTVGQYEYMMIPGLDLPVVVNGRVVTYPVNINTTIVTPTPEATDVATAEPTSEATDEATDEPEETPDATEAPGGEETPEATDAPGGGEPTPEVTEPPTGGNGGNGGGEPTPEVTAPAP